MVSGCVVLEMMNKDGSIGLEPGAETVYGTDDTTMVMSEKVSNKIDELARHTNTLRTICLHRKLSLSIFSQSLGACDFQ